MALKKKDTETKTVKKTKTPYEEAEAFCDEHGIGGCCRETIKRTWHLR